MKKSKNDIVAFPAFSAQTEAQPTESRLPDQAHAESGRTVEPEDRQDAVSGGELDALTELVGKDIHPADVVEFCRKNGMDERTMFGVLGRIESVRLRGLFRDRAIMSVSASDILGDGPIKGIDETVVRRVFGYMCASYWPYECGYISLDEYEWIRPKLKRSLVAGVSEVMRRLVSRMRNAVGVVYQVEDRVNGYSDDIFNEPTASDIIDGLIDGRFFDDPHEADDVRVYLETKPGEYDSLPCKMVQAEAEKFAGKPEDLRDPGQLQVDGLHNNNPAHAPEDEPVMYGIANAFGNWIRGANDEVLSYIVRHHELPAGWGPLTYIGSGNDARCFWENVGMRPAEFNRCFGCAFKTNSGHLRQLDYDALTGDYKGIYVPLSAFGLLKRLAKLRAERDPK